MTYGQVRDQALMLINQYSLAGDQIASTYNNQADYRVRIPALIDEAMLIIASSYRRLEEYKELRVDPTRDALGMPTYKLPDDIMDIMPGGLLVVKENPHRMFRYDSGWEKVDRHHIILPKRGKHFKGRLFLQYYRNPRSVWQCCSDCCEQMDDCVCSCTPTTHGTGTTATKEPPDCVVLDNDPETHIPIPYYVAAFLVMGEDQASHYALYNQWIAMLPGLMQAPQPHRAIVEDSYGLDHMYDWGEW